MRAGLVTTLRGAGSVLDSFLRYHLALGFARLYLFFDDPADPAIEIARRRDDGRVTILMAGSELEAEWRQCVQYAHYAPHVGREVMARQCLNVEVAVQYALADQLDWLLHIDADEIFHCPGQDAGSHFARLAKKGIDWFPTMELTSLELVQTYVAEGYGIGLGAHVPQGKLRPGVRAIVLEDFPCVNFGLIWHGKMSCITEAVAEELEKRAQEVITPGDLAIRTKSASARAAASKAIDSRPQSSL